MILDRVQDTAMRITFATRRRLKTLFLVALICLLLYFSNLLQLPSSTFRLDPSYMQIIDKNMIEVSSSKAWQERPMHYESEQGFKDRLLIEEKFRFGSQIKSLNEEFFSKKDGVNESLMDSYPIFRSYPDRRPEGCKELTYPVSRATVSVIFTYHNEILSLLLRFTSVLLLFYPMRS